MRKKAIFSFGIQIEPQFGYEKQEIDVFAHHIENNQLFDTIWISDHMFLSEDSIKKSSFDAWTLMTYLASRYSFRIGSLVLCNSYHIPSLLAKKIVTLDHLSEGRVEIGYGAGWKKIEYEAYGIEYGTAKSRLEKLEEALQVILKLWSQEDKVSFSGKHYSLKEAISYPKPYQKPHPRLWIGTMTGGDKMLKIIAKYGDGINLAWSFPPYKVKEIFQRLDNYCKEYNRDSNNILRSIGFWVRLFENQREKEVSIVEEAQKRQISVETYEKRIEGALMGTKDELIEKLAQYRDLGITHFIFMFPYREEISYLKQFTNNIIPKIK